MCMRRRTLWLSYEGFQEFNEIYLFSFAVVEDVLQIASVTFEREEFICKVAQDIAQAKTLIEAGFEYVTDMDEFKIFRKRK